MDDLIGNLMKDPLSRRHIMNMYQYSDLRETPGLYPCAYETIWSVRKVGEDKVLDMTLIQRSNDLFDCRIYKQDTICCFTDDGS
jgi:thymidylate synthase